jgi:hypothetical protein
MEEHVIDVETGEVKQYALSPVSTLTATRTPDEALHQLSVLQAFVESCFRPADYGLLPGTDKKMLKKSGAEKLLEIYGLWADPKTIKEDRDFSLEPPFFEFTIECTIRQKGTNSEVARQLASCNSWETKYRYREAQRKCPNCGLSTIGTSKKEWGGGYYCNYKKGGCGQSWKEFQTEKHTPTQDELKVVQEIKAQQVGLIPNPNVFDARNTILKMAQKRAVTGATIMATRSSGIFEADDMAEAFNQAKEEEAVATVTPAEPVEQPKQTYPDDLDTIVPDTERKAFVMRAKEEGVSGPALLKHFIQTYGLKQDQLSTSLTYGMLEETWQAITSGTFKKLVEQHAEEQLRI